MPGVVTELRRRAELWVYDGDPDRKDFKRRAHDCRVYHAPTKTILVFSRHSGAHSQGGFVSPLCERCYHLSISFVDFEGERPLPVDGKRLAEWTNEFFGQDIDLVWAEAPAGTGLIETTFKWMAGKDPGDMLFWHFRLFCNKEWRRIVDCPKDMERDLRGRGWVRARELVIDDSARRPYWPVRVWRKTFC